MDNIHGQALTSIYDITAEFERKLCDYTGAPYAVAVDKEGIDPTDVASIPVSLSNPSSVNIYVMPVYDSGRIVY